MSVAVYDRVAVGVYANAHDAVATMRMLQEMKISIERISIVGRDGLQLEGSMDNLLGPEPAVMSPETCIADLPGLGPFVVVGPLARLLDSVTFTDGSGDVAGQMTFAEIATDYYHSLLESRHFLVIVHCTELEAADVLSVLETCQSQNPRSYQFAGADAVYSTPK
jgi:hypothetical protein